MIRLVKNELQVSCACTLQPQSTKSVGLNGGGRNVYVFWGATYHYADTVRIFNAGEHYGEFTEDDRIGVGRHRAG